MTDFEMMREQMERIAKQKEWLLMKEKNEMEQWLTCIKELNINNTDTITSQSKGSISYKNEFLLDKGINTDETQ